MLNVRTVVMMMAGSTLLALAGCSGGVTSPALLAAASSAAKVTTKNAYQGQAAGFVDVDGDGIDDMVSCAPYALSGDLAGMVFVYAGSPNGFTAQPMLQLSGDDNLGFEFVRLKDVDGDGKDDFAVSALHGSGDDVSLSGSVTIYKGGSNGKVITKIAGDTALDKFGYALRAGDLNGDGVPELIIGAPFNSPTPALFQGGAVYVYDIKNAKRLYFPATAAVGAIGWTVASGDLNNDGMDDLIYSATGKVLVYYGKADFMTNPGTPSVTISRNSILAAGYGKALALLPDLNADGFRELLIGATQEAISGGTDTGAVYVVKGGAGVRTISLDAPGPDLFTKITGEAAYDRFGSAIAPVGDVDADGKPDFAVSAVHADSGGFKMTGKVHLFKGKDLVAGSTPASAGTSFAAPGKDMHFGRFMTSFQKNGSRLLIGAPNANQNSGGVYAVDLLSGTQLFQAVVGGVTTTSATCCQ
jgi:hypothetical protein